MGSGADGAHWGVGPLLQPRSHGHVSGRGQAWAESGSQVGVCFTLQAGIGGGPEGTWTTVLDGPRGSRGAWNSSQLSGG